MRRWSMGWLYFCGWVGWLSIPGPVQAAEPRFRDLVYAEVDGHALRLDVYPPRTPATASPLIVWIHGGAWRSGSKDKIPVERWLEHGFTIASVDYRLSPVARFPAQVHDIKAAIRFLRAEASRFQVDPQRIVIAGNSAGGHLAALVGVSRGVAALEGKVGTALDQDSSVQAIVSFYGASNLQSILGQSTAHGLSVRVPALQLLLGGLPDQQVELARLASPTVHVDPGDPPLWLIHGDADPQMPIDQSRELEQAYRRQQLPVELDTIVGGQHGGPEFFDLQRLDRLARQLQQAPP
jgi:acetyl esterase/lipase